MKLMTAAITAFFLSIGIASAQQAGNMVQSYQAPPTQQDLDAMANNGWNLISVVPVVANGATQYFVAYFDGLPPKASNGVNCNYTDQWGKFSRWFEKGPTKEQTSRWVNSVCR